ncbi:hypothetical protein GW17_00010137 [Ensete ventricosum]|nr:hypothetical protein GW17_00010137 [Ensete ventricosum]
MISCAFLFLHSILCYFSSHSPLPLSLALSPHGHHVTFVPILHFLQCRDEVVRLPLKKSPHSPTAASSPSHFPCSIHVYASHCISQSPLLTLFSPKIRTLDLADLQMASFVSSTTIVILLLFLHASLTISSSTTTITSSPSKSQKTQALGEKSTIDTGEKGGKVQSPTALKKKPILSTKNQTKLLKPKKANSTTAAATVAAGSRTSNSTIKIKLGKSLNATLKASNSTKLLKTIKPIKSNSTKSSKDHLKSLNSTSNSTKPSKKAAFDPPIAKNKTTSTSKATKPQQPTKPTPAKDPAMPKAKPEESTAWVEGDDDVDDTDLISDFRDLPSRLLPDLERLSTTSKAYISAANRGIAEGVKPYVGKSFAPKVAAVLSSIFLALPLLLLTLLFRRLRAYLSLHRLLLFIQAYLAIYFATLAATALATGLEPLRFFYATSPASYTWTQAAQTMGYLVYLVLQLVDLVSVFSGGKDAGGSGPSARALALAQMVIGLAVGMHYYAAVFHRAVSGEAPRANWRVHGVYAACFLVICACARAERRKKAYYEGGEDGKKS